MSRRVLVAGGAVVAVAAVFVGWRLTIPTTGRTIPTGCVRYHLVPVERICGDKVVWINPDGSRVVIGTVNQMRPMPRPLPAPGQRR